VLTARDLSMALTDPFGLWHEHHGDVKLKDGEDEYTNFLKEQGMRCEQALLTSRHKRFVSLKDRVFDDATEETERLLGIDGSVIHSGALRSEQLKLRARPDVICVRNGTHMIEEYKLGSKPDDADKIQALFYAYVMRKGYGVESDCIIVTRKLEEFVILYDEGYIEEIIGYARNILSSSSPPCPVYNCEGSEWGVLQNQKARDSQDVSLARNVGIKHARKLHDIGIHTVAELASASPDALKSIKGLGPKKIPQILCSARAQATGQTLRLGTWDLAGTGSELELYLDLEGSGELFEEDPSWNCIYLIGLIPRNGNQQGDYIHYIAKRPADERTMLVEFLEYLQKGPRSYRLYHWHSYEKTQLAKACERHGLTNLYQTRVLPHLKDLCKAAQSTFVLPMPTWSIKEVAPYFGFRWTQDIGEVDAMTSAMIWYKQAIDGGTGTGLEMVTQYNKDDCMAMLVVKDGFDRLDKEIT